MPRRTLARRSTLTALANGLFGAGVLVLFVVLYGQGSFRGSLLPVAGLLLVGAIATWIAAAQWGSTGEDTDRTGRPGSN